MENNTQKNFASDVHSDITYDAAIAAGFEDSIAQTIAKANNEVDGDWWYDGAKWIVAGSKDRGYPHYMTDSDANREFNWKMAESVIQFRMQIACRNLLEGNELDFAINLGRALHTYQDRISHTKDGGIPMTDKEHGLLRGTDSLQKRPELRNTVISETKRLLEDFYTIYSNRQCPIKLFHRQKVCAIACPYWASYRSATLPQ